MVEERGIGDWERGLEENGCGECRNWREWVGEGMIAKYFGVWRSRGRHMHWTLVALHEEPDQTLFNSFFFHHSLSFCFFCCFCKMDEGRTQAPPLLSESDLIGLMDQKGIGTDATIAEHIQKIQQRKVGVGTTAWGGSETHAYARGSRAFSG